MDFKIKENVEKRLRAIEKEHGVNILYAVESGSRAWGFESQDSDYDVRFIYAHNKNWYLNILAKRDVIEYPIVDEFDYSGWDLRKTFFLLNKSNPVLFEWLKSPIVYRKDSHFHGIMEKLARVYFSPISSTYHYLHMARGNYRQYLQEEAIKIKKYFYVLRPIMACMWIERYREAPPMLFEELLAQIKDRDLLEKITELLNNKRMGMELGVEPKIKIINDFIDEKLKYFEESVSSFNPQKDSVPELLEEGFVKILDYIENLRLASLANSQREVIS